MFVLKRKVSQQVKKGLLFLHIPKTAGTSFRVAAKNPFWGLKVYTDYGDRSSSSRFIRKCYKKKDFSPIATISEKKTILVGHFFLKKYANYYPVQNVITFVREPVQRILSHYHYMIRTNRYEGSLESFVGDKRYQNIQSRSFSNYPIESIGFIGITEKYFESLLLINKYYSLKLRVKHVNKNKKMRNTCYDEDEDLISLIKEHNEEDIKIYNKAYQIFLSRMEAEKAEINFSP